MLKALGENLKARREDAELTQQQLATYAKLSIATVNEIERGKIEDLRLSTLTAIGRVLKMADSLKLLKK